MICQRLPMTIYGGSGSGATWVKSNVVVLTMEQHFEWSQQTNGRRH